MARSLLLCLLVSAAACSSSTPGAAPDAGTPTDDAGTQACGPEEAARRPDVTAALCGGQVGLPSNVAVSDEGRRFTVTCGARTVTLSVVDESIIRLRYGDAPGSTPAVVGPGTPAPLPRVGNTCDGVFVCTGALALKVRHEDCRVVAVDASGTVLLEDPTGGGAFEQTVAGRTTRGVLRNAATGEHFYGFGEKTGALDKRGTRMTMWNTDAYDSTLGGFRPDGDPLYASIPFFIGLRGTTAYGVFTDNSSRLDFDMAASSRTTYRITASSGIMDQYLIAGPAMADVVGRYTALTGRTPLPPRWTLGYHQSRWGWYPDTRFTEVASRFRQEGIPADGLWFDIQHLRGFRSFTWDSTGFPNPAGLIAGLAQQGFKSTVIVDPAVKAEPGWDIYDSGLAGGHFLKDAQGSVYVGEVWPGAAVFPDFSAPATRQWWGGLVARPLSLGVRGLWIDMNEPSNFVQGAEGTVPNTLLASGDGSRTTMAEAHNLYGLNEARAVFEGMRAAAPDRRPFIITRAGYAGIQRYAGLWTGDAVSSFTTLRATLPMLMGLGLSGVPFVGSDVGGYSGNASPELFARWMELGSISPFFRGHVEKSSKNQEPWEFGTEVRDISRETLSLRYELLPYFYSLFAESQRTGAPVLRPLVYEFQGDVDSQTLDDEAMLGPWLLAAPVLDAGATARTVYLPPGRWFELASGAIREGPSTFTTDVTQAALPLWVREGAIIPRGPRMQWSDEKPLSPLSLEVYPGEQPSSFTLYEDDGDSMKWAQGESSRITYTLSRSETGARLVASARTGSYVPPSRSLVVRVRRVDTPATAVRLGGEALTKYDSEAVLQGSGTGKGWFYDGDDLSLVAVIPDGAGFTLDFTYDPTITDPRPPVPVTLHVKVPAGTPHTTPIHVASSANGWTQQPLSWGPGADEATGTLLVPRGEWFFYKYTRGGWPTVEKWPGCQEATNRYAFGRTHPVKEDTVFAWADQCTP